MQKIYNHIKENTKIRGFIKLFSRMAIITNYWFLEAAKICELNIFIYRIIIFFPKKTFLTVKPGKQNWQHDYPHRQV